MDDFIEIWRLFERLVSIIVALLLALYLFRCLMTGDFLNLSQFAGYVKGLFTYLFR